MRIYRLQFGFLFGIFSLGFNVRKLFENTGGCTLRVAAKDIIHNTIQRRRHSPWLVRKTNAIQPGQSAVPSRAPAWLHAPRRVLPVSVHADGSHVFRQSRILNSSIYTLQSSVCVFSRFIYVVPQRFRLSGVSFTPNSTAGPFARRIQSKKCRPGDVYGSLNDIAVLT